MSVVSFCFESNPVRTLGDSLNPLFVALDICKALGFKNPRDAVKDHVDPEDLCKEEITDSLNRKQLVNCVNESGMYALIFGSKLPSAKRFKKWVTSEVLPTIRKTGQYSAGDNTLKSTDTLTPAQQLLVRQAVAQRVKGVSTCSLYVAIYRAIHAKFNITKYDQLPQSELSECLRFIQEMELITPDLQSQQPTLSSNDLANLSVAVGMLDYDIKAREEVLGLIEKLDELTPIIYRLHQLKGALYESPREARMRLKALLNNQNNLALSR